MRWIAIFLACLSFSAWSANASSDKDLDAISHFDHPFLLGDWYLINPEPDSSQENFIAIKLTLDSNYHFSIDIQKRDFSVDHWEGMYNANEDTIILGLHTDAPQIYSYASNHNMLNLNGVMFTKALSNSLAGIWSSEHLAGDDLLASEVNQMDLILQPDFVFLFKVSNQDGDEAVRRGVYFTEGEHLVLLYEDGEHNARYKLNRDKLTIESDEGGMFAVLNRIR
ncbi:hypothetical protein H2O73_11195 [Vibrio sp. 404]|uniref:WD40 repeat protein n=1 Tax=Vibrio marinisediminis TaxID=2758441 RepID=A0A7W2FRI2_9VIBR|nr:hypothetical protein [Vibrio marinisediminis]MBA5762913.1 hypothetical protein [Vibrio marinisediminis]